MKKIVVIEDNLDIRENIVELLELSGYEVEEADNGKEGAKLALEVQPDLILCDIMMPELDGYGVLNVLSKHKETINTPFIFLTAKAEKIDIRKGMSLGADDYITKPYDETDLLNAIENRIRKSEHAPSQQTGDLGLDDLFSNKRIKNYAAGEIIYTESDSPSYVYYVKSGKVKLSKMNDMGKEVIVELCKNNDFFGYWSVLQETNEAETSQVIEQSEIWQIPTDHFKDYIAKSRTISSTFLKLLSRNLLLRENKILELAYESVRKRVANSLVALCDVYGENEEFAMKVPRELIASMAGTSVETAIRMLSEFKKDGLIAINGGDIKLLDYQALKKAPY